MTLYASDFMAIELLASDSVGPTKGPAALQKRMNLTKTIRKLPINEDGQRAGYYVHDDLSNLNIKYDEPQVGGPMHAIAILP